MEPICRTVSAWDQQGSGTSTHTLHGSIDTRQHGDLCVPGARRESLVGQGDKGTVVVFECKLVAHDTKDVDTNVPSLSRGEGGPQGRHVGRG